MPQQRQQKNPSQSNGQQEREKGDPPVWSRRVFTGSATCEAAVFEKTVNEGTEGEFVAYNVSLKRVFKQEDQYKTSAGFRSEDVPFVIQLLTQAYSFICEQNSKR
jgi:hypothetical protein